MVNKVISKRGGARKRMPIETGAVALLDAIWRKFGGPALISQKLNISPQAVVNWRRRGKVPLTRVHEVANALNISPWGLNYKEIRDFYGKEGIPTWKEVVNSYNLSPSTARTILSIKPI